MRSILHAKYVENRIYFFFILSIFKDKNFKINVCLSVTNNTRICGAAKIGCCAKADNSIYVSGAFEKCKCFPACTSIIYDADTSQADYDLVSSYSHSRFQPDFNFEK